MKENDATSDRATNLIWIDLEMTGLDTASDAIIEIATVVTDKHLNELAEGPVFAIHQPESVLDAMDDWNTRHHGASGLTDRFKYTYGAGFRMLFEGVTLRADLATGSEGTEMILFIDYPFSMYSVDSPD